jgi:hypothetical protein
MSACKFLLPGNKKAEKRINHSTRARYSVIIAIKRDVRTHKHLTRARTCKMKTKTQTMHTYPYTDTPDGTLLSRNAASLHLLIRVLHLLHTAVRERHRALRCQSAEPHARLVRSAYTHRHTRTCPSVTFAYTCSQYIYTNVSKYAHMYASIKYIYRRDKKTKAANFGGYFLGVKMGVYLVHRHFMCDYVCILYIYTYGRIHSVKYIAQKRQKGTKRSLQRQTLGRLLPWHRNGCESCAPTLRV